MSSKSLLSLGIDFGSSRVKGCLMEQGSDRILASFGAGWQESGCNRLNAGDWLRMLKVVTNQLLSKNRLAGSDLHSIAFATVAPCITLVGSGMDATSGPVMQYDEPVPQWAGNSGGQDTRFTRTAEAISVLAPWTPRTAGTDPVLLTANGWLVWQLTGELTMDSYSVTELGLDSYTAPPGARLPDRLVAPSDIAGTIQPRAAREFGLGSGTVVAAGCSDSFALGVGAGLMTSQHMIYLGTFFTVMEATRRFDPRQQLISTDMPYLWHLSMPIGSVINRIASSLFPTVHSTYARVELLLKEARQCAQAGGAGMRLDFDAWKLGVPLGHIPRPAELVETVTVGSISLAPIATFVEALKQYFHTHDVTEVRLGGGLALHDWLGHYIARETGVTFDPALTIVGAEGAAMIASQSLSGNNEGLSHE